MTPTQDGIYKGILVPELPWKRVKVEEKPVEKDTPDYATCSECGGPLVDHECRDCDLVF